MPIDFSRIPSFLSEKIAQRMEFDDMMEFNNSSQMANSVINWSRLALPDDVQEVDFCFFEEKLHVRFVSSGGDFEDYMKSCLIPSIPFVGLKIVIEGTLTNAFCESLVSFFLEKGADGNKLVLESSCEAMEHCSSDAILELLKAADATELVSHCVVPPSVLRILPEKISKVKVDSPIEDEDLAEIKRAELDISGSNIGNVGLNNLLLEWSSGVRVVDAVYISTETRLSIPQILNGISHQRTEEDRQFILNNGNQILHCAIGENGYMYVATDVHKL